MNLDEVIANVLVNLQGNPQVITEEEHPVNYQKDLGEMETVMKTNSYESSFFLNDRSGVPHLVCQALPFPHGFTTRLGGVSHGNGLDTLDLGAADTAETEENRRRFAESFGLPREALFFAKQVHGTTIESVTASDRGRAFVCDGFVTRETGLLLAVKTADCLPLLLGDPEAGVIAAVHAGWRGTIAGIATHAVTAMTSLGASLSRIVAAIGPGIRSCCYEVDSPFVETVRQTAGDDLLRFVTPDPHKKDRFRADLADMNRYLLLSAGLRQANLYATGFCTSCASDLFFSHRASGGRRGLLMAGICRLPDRTP